MNTQNECDKLFLVEALETCSLEILMKSGSTQGRVHDFGKRFSGIKNLLKIPKKLISWQKGAVISANIH